MAGPDIFNDAPQKKKRVLPQHITVDMGNREDVKSVGGSINTRLMMSVRDEFGRVVKGFFTENFYNSKKEVFDSLFSPAKRTDTEKHKEYAEYLKKIFDDEVLYGLPDQVNTSQSYSTAVSASDFIDNYLTYHYADDPLASDRSARKRVDFFKKNFADNMVNYSIQQTKVIEWLQSKKVAGADDSDYEKYAGDKEFWSYLGEILGAAAVAENAVGTAQIARQSENANINKRNNAMYDYASLLGEPDLLARSSAMTVKWKGRTIHGTFMEKAKGIERKDVFKNAKNKGHKKLTFSGTAMQQLSKLQILDYLCANDDRHYNNWFYETVETDKETKIVGIQGIDNDNSFGTIDHKGPGAYSFMSKLEDIKLIDGAMARKIMELTPEKLEKTLHLAELSAEEVNAAYQRLADLQEQIQAGKIEIVEGEKAWDKKYRSDPTFKKLAYAEGSTMANIFQMAKEVGENYKKSLEKSKKKAAEAAKNKKKQAPASQENAEQKDPEVPQKAAPKDAGYARGESRNINDEGRLSYLEDRLNAFRKQLGQSDLQGLELVKAQLKNTIETVGKLKQAVETARAKDKRTPLYQKGAPDYRLNDFQRNVLSESLKYLSQNAEKYAAAHSQDMTGEDVARRNIVNSVKNLAAFSDFSRERVRNDSAEAEMDLARYSTGKFMRERGLFVFDPSVERKALRDIYTNLRNKISKVDKAYIKSSDKFKKMLKAFKELKDAPDISDALENLATTAKDYLDFKVPNEDESGLSDYAKSRVQFAREIKAFAKRAQDSVNPNGYSKKAKEMINFSNNCAALLNNYTNAKFTKDPNKIVLAENAILKFGAQVDRGVTDMVQASGAYGEDHTIQQICYVLTAGHPGTESPIKKITAAHTEILAGRKNADLEDKKYSKLQHNSKFLDSFAEKLKNYSAVKKTLPAPQAESKAVSSAEKKKKVSVLS